MKPPVVKLPFSLKTWGTALVVNRAGGLLKREACVYLELLSLLASVHQTPNALFYSPKGDSGSAGATEGGAILNCIR